MNSVTVFLIIVGIAGLMILLTCQRCHKKKESFRPIKLSQRKQCLSCGNSYYPEMCERLCKYGFNTI